MTPEKSNMLGRKYSLHSAIIIFLTFELIYLVPETKRDFANGIIFFIDQQMNAFTIFSYVIFFASFILLGQRAGKQILILKVSPLKIGLLYGLISTILLLTYYSIPIIQAQNIRSGIYNESELNQEMQSFLRFSFGMFVCISLGWLLTTWRIHRSRNNSDNLK